MIPSEKAASGSTISSNRLTDAELVEQLCVSLEQRLRAGDDVRSESILAEYPQLAVDPEQALDLIYAEFVTRSELGENPTTDEFIARFPQWQTLLERQFQFADAIDNNITKVEFVHRLGAGGEPILASSSDRRFRIGKLLARGGIGQVMRGIDTDLNREVAIKEIQPELSHNLDVRERFLREAEITGQLEHPGIVPVYGLGRDLLHRPFYAMRLVRGQSLHEAIEAFHATATGTRQFYTLEMQKFLRRFLSVCDTIGYAHSRGVIHRDLKPQNILLGPFGETLVVDWGLAKVFDPSQSTSKAGDDGLLVDECSPKPSEGGVQKLDVDRAEPTTPQPNWRIGLTQTPNTLIGTPAFMSPEQACGESHRVGPASDIYSLGATLFSLLTGQSRFGKSDVQETLKQVCEGSFPRPRQLNGKVPRSLEAICLKAMEQEPSDRYATVGELASDIEHWLADEPVSVCREKFIHRTARWMRRNRTAAILGLMTLLLVSAISTSAAIRINGEKLRADQERMEARRSSALLTFERGYQLTEENEHGQAMHWFARALKQSPVEDRDMRRVILTNMSAARLHLLQHRHVFAHNQAILVSAFSNDGQQLLTADLRGLAKIWDANSGEMLSEHQLEPPQPIAATATEDGNFIVATVLKRTATIHKLSNLSENPVANRLKVVHDESVVYACFSPGGAYLATGSRADGPNTLKIWRTSDGRRLSERINPSPIVRITFQPKGRIIAVVGSDGKVRMWDWQKNSSDAVLLACDEKVHRVSFTEDGRMMFIGTLDGSVECWQAERNRRLFHLCHHASPVTSIASSSDGETVSVAWDAGFVRTWSIRDRRLTCEALRVDRYTSNLEYRPALNQVLILGGAEFATLWELPNSQKTSTPLDQPSISGVKYSHDGSLVVTSDRTGKARLREGNSGRSFEAPLTHQALIREIAISPDAKKVLTSDSIGVAKIWNAHDGSLHGEPLEHRKDPEDRVAVISGTFSPDGRLAATGDLRGLIKIWDVASCKLMNTLDGEKGPVNSMVFSPKGDQLLSGHLGRDCSVQMWRTSTGEQLWTAKHRGFVRSVAISSNGELALSASNDGTARIWNAENGEPRSGVLSHRGEVLFARFSPDDSLIVTGGYDSTVRLWNTADGKPYGTPMSHEGVVTDAAFSADGRNLVTGSIDKSARLWDVATCLPLSVPLLHDQNVSSVGIHPDGKLAITGRIWHLPSPLPDKLATVDRWVRLATRRVLDAGNNVQWLDSATFDNEANQFQDITGQLWSEWGD